MSLACFPLGWAESSLNRHSPSYKAFQLKQTLPPISVQLYGHHNIAPEGSLLPKGDKFFSSCVLSWTSSFLPGLEWPLLQRSSVRLWRHLEGWKHSGVAGWMGLDADSWGTAKTASIRFWGLLVPAPASLPSPLRCWQHRGWQIFPGMELLSFKDSWRHGGQVGAGLSPK